MNSQRKHLQYVIMLYCFKKDDNANNTADCRDLYCLREQCYNYYYNWLKRFRGGNFDLKDEGRNGRLATTNMDFTNIILSENPQYSVQKIVNATNPRNR